MENRPSDKRSQISLDSVLREVAELENSHGRPDRIWSLSDIDDLLASTTADSATPADEDDAELLTSIDYYKTNTPTMIRRRSRSPYIHSRKSRRLRSPRPLKNPRRRLPRTSRRARRMGRLLPQKRNLKSPTKRSLLPKAKKSAKSCKPRKLRTRHLLRSLKAKIRLKLPKSRRK